MKVLVNAADFWNQHIDSETISRLVYRHTLDENCGFLQMWSKLQAHLSCHFSYNYMLCGGLDCEPTRTVLLVSHQKLRILKSGSRQNFVVFTGCHPKLKLW